jgi:hypothetical protein
MKGISWSIGKRRNDVVDNKTPYRRLDKQTSAHPAEAAAPSVTWSYFLGNIFNVWTVKLFFISQKTIIRRKHKNVT